MKIVWLYLLLYFGLLLSCLAADDPSNYYWVSFTDKKGTSYSVDRPEEFLSAEALNRRYKQGIDVDEQDLPVSQNYLDSLTSKGAKIIHHSKWLNGATILATEAEFQTIINSFTFIREAELTKPGIILKSARNKFAIETASSNIDTAYYGYSVHQVSQLNGQFLHQQDYLGQGMLVAVLDAGFYKANELPAFEKLLAENRLLGTRDFVNPLSNIFLEDDHGMSVLSTMAGELPGLLIGTAPKASYYLIRSEDAASEFLIEEDNWVVGAEFADSVGADIINSSLGYFLFDDESMNHTYAQMDGKTTRVTQAANIAFQKGMLVVTSAGNEANDPWHYIIAPSDGDQVIGVAAVDKNRHWAPFSSVGPSSDNEVKPNVAAMGLASVVQRDNGELGTANGTSFSSPILAGMAACLWQAFPKASNWQVKSAIEESASRYTAPDTLLGYGIPDFELAFSILQKKIKEQAEGNNYTVSPNPFVSELLIRANKPTIENTEVHISLVQANGKLVLNTVLEGKKTFHLGNLANLPGGFYILSIESGGEREFHKLIKTKP